MEDVELSSLELARLEEIIGSGRARQLSDVDLPRVADVFGTAKVFNINSTAAGGGVAEMLQVLLAYTKGAGLDSCWLTIKGNPEFFEITKRLHNHLYGTPGDGGALGERELELYREVLDPERSDLAARLSPGDLVVLHDPQVAGLAEEARRAGARVVWRCHVGVDTPNEYSEKGWDFLRPLVEPFVERFVFSRREFAPSWIDPARLRVITPSIDPFAVKNWGLPEPMVRAILARSGIIDGNGDGASFERSKGIVGHIQHPCEVVRDGPPVASDIPLVVQVSRWDPMKDMAGVMAAFVNSVASQCDAHLVLAGPAVTSVADDPEAAKVFSACREEWEALSPDMRRRVHLVLVPMDDPEENAAVINALQRHASVVTQKSLAEGFGLTVAEAMYKSTPVVAERGGRHRRSDRRRSDRLPGPAG